MAVNVLMPYMTSADDLVQLKVPALLLSGRKRASRGGIAEAIEPFISASWNMMLGLWSLPLYGADSILEVVAPGLRSGCLAQCEYPTGRGPLPALYRAVAAQVYYRNVQHVCLACRAIYNGINQTNKQTLPGSRPVQTGPRVIVAIRLEGLVC
jgi:hypothetical protein